VLRFCGFDLELVVEEVLNPGDWPSLCSASDMNGNHWLIVQVDHDPTRLTWLCARLSERAMRAVRAGQCTPADVLCHSATGTVELVTVEHGRAVPDRCVLCERVPELLRSRPPDRVAVAA
jgi:hypothetical protein